jgi:hypothetical protein
MARAIARSGRGYDTPGTRTSLRRVLRLMREHDLLAPGRVGPPRGPRTHDGPIIPETIDTTWGTDLTTTFTGEGPAAVFSAVDYCIPIRLLPITTACSVPPLPGIEPGICWRLDPSGDPQQGPERIEWVEAAVETEREFVEVRL